MSYLLASAIFGPAFHDAEVAAELDDAAYFRALLEVEVALARVQAGLGIIPAPAALAIEAASQSLVLDASALARGVLRDGVPTIELVSALRAAAGEVGGAFVHQGATSQDIMDTATVLCLRRALGHVERGLRELVARLAAIAHEHRGSVMVARTHGQQALPITFGLKVAGWALPCVRHLERLQQLAPRLLVVQLGGAAGTLAAFGARAEEVVAGLGSELGLGVSELPWHVQRDSVAELGGWLSLLACSLAKLAQDVILLCQSEVAEVSEAKPGERGGSSSMPQKNNPMRSEQIIAAARSVAAQLSALHQASIVEHERGTHGWQLEWLSLSSMLMLAAGALRNARELAAELQVDPARMRQNLQAHGGLALAEAVVGALSEHMPRPAARALVKACAERARSEGHLLIDVVREQVAAESGAGDIDWARLARPEHYLGLATPLIDHTLARIRAALSPTPRAPFQPRV